MSDLKLKIQGNGNFVLIEDLRYSYPNDEKAHSYDRNWLTGLVSLKSGGFSGEYLAYFQTTDYNNLKSELEELYNNLEGTAKFCTLEGQLEMEFIGDGLGHFEINCMAMDEAGRGSELNFTINIDQTDLKSIVEQLNKLTQALAVR